MNKRLKIRGRSISYARTSDLETEEVVQDVTLNITQQTNHFSSEDPHTTTQWENAVLTR